jgi:hypothetical protein
MEKGPVFKGNVKEIRITGTLCPFETDVSPCLFRVPGSENYYVAVFTSEEKLRQMCAFAGQKNYKVKQVTDGTEFLEDLFANGIRVMHDPYVKEGGKIGWFEVNKDGSFN